MTDERADFGQIANEFKTAFGMEWNEIHENQFEHCILQKLGCGRLWCFSSERHREFCSQPIC